MSYFCTERPIEEYLTVPHRRTHRKIIARVAHETALKVFMTNANKCHYICQCHSVRIATAPNTHFTRDLRSKCIRVRLHPLVSQCLLLELQPPKIKRRGLIITAALVRVVVTTCYRCLFHLLANAQTRFVGVEAVEHETGLAHRLTADVSASVKEKSAC